MPVAAGEGSAGTSNKKPRRKVQPAPRPSSPPPAPVVIHHSPVTPNTNGSRAYPGRNPRIPFPTNNPSSSYYKPPTVKSPVTSRLSSWSYTQKLVNTAGSMIGDPLTTSYWASDLIDYKRQEMADRRAAAQRDYFNKLKDYQNRAEAAISHGRTNWLENHPVTRDDFYKVEKGPYDATLINTHLEDFIKTLRNTPQDMRKPASWAFDDELTAAVAKARGDNYTQTNFDATMDKLAVEAKKKERSKAYEAAHPPKTILNPKTAKYEPNPAYFAAQQEKQKQTAASAVENLKAYSGSHTLGNVFGDYANVISQLAEGKRPEDMPLRMPTEINPTSTQPEFIDPKTGKPFERVELEHTSKVNDAVAGGAMVALKQLQRPLSAVASGADEWYASDKDQNYGKGGFWNTVTQGPVGRNALYSVDDMFSDPSNVWHVIKAMGSGFKDNDTSFANVIRNQGKRDPRRGANDSESYQAWMGLGMDVGMDPLNFIGVGIIDKVNTGLKLTRDAMRTAEAGKTDLATQQFANKIWKQYKQIPKDQRLPDGPQKLDDVVDIMTGKRGNAGRPAPWKFSSQKEKIRYYNNAKVQIDALALELDKFGLPVNSKIKNLSSLVDRLHVVRAKKMQDAESVASMDALERTLQSRVNRGELTVDEANEIQNYSLTVPHLNQVFTRVAQSRRAGRNYDALVEQRRLDIASGKPQHVVDATTRKLDALRNRVDDAFDSDNIYDALGPKWHYNTEFTADETNKLADNLYRHLTYKSETGAKYISPLNERFSKLQDEIKDITIQRNKDLRADTPSSRNSADLASYKLKKLYAKANSIQSAAFIRVLEAYRAQRATGGKAYTDPERASTLFDQLAGARAKLDEPNVSYTGTKPDGRLDDVTPVGPTDGSLEPNADYFDSHSHMNAVVQDTLHELKGLQVFEGKYGVRHVPSFDNKVLNLGERFPSSLASDDGTLDVDRALSLLNVDPNTMKAVVRDDVTGPEAAYAKELLGVVNDRMIERYLQEQKKVTRSAREAFRAKVEKNINDRFGTSYTVDDLSREQQDAMTMFGADLDTGIERLNSGKGLSPIVTGPTGERVALGSNRFKELFTDSITPKDIKRHQDIVQAIEHAKSWVRTPDKVKLDRKLIERARNTLRDAGYVDVPKGANEIAKYLSRNAARYKDLDEFTVLGSRLFKEEHNISIVDARIKRDHAFPPKGRVVEDPRSKGYQFNPDGLITIDEFIRAHFEDAAQFRKLTEKGPFKFRYGKQSEKEWRQRGQVDHKDDSWYRETHKLINVGMDPEKRMRLIRQTFDRTVTAQTKSIEKIIEAERGRMEAALSSRGNQWISPKEREAISQRVVRETFDYTKAGLENGTLKTSGIDHQSLPLGSVVGVHSTPEEIHQALIYRLGNKADELEDAKRAIGLDKSQGAKEDLKRINEKIDRLKQQIAQEKIDYKARRAEGKAASAEYVKRLHEETLLKLLTKTVQNPGKGFALHTMGMDLKIPGSDKLLAKIGSVASENKIAQTFKSIYEDTFMPPSKRFGEFADAYRERTAQSARRIQVNLEELNATLNKYPPSVRKSAFKAILKNRPEAFTGTAEQYKDFENAFRPIVQSFRNNERIGDFSVTIDDINRYLSPKFKMDTRVFEGKKEQITPSDIIEAIRKQTKRDAKQVGKAPDYSHLSDPVDVVWSLRLAVEQARGHKSFMKALGETFGIRNQYNMRGPQANFNEVLGKLQKDSGWRKVDELGHGYVFPSETADMIDKMLKNLEPIKVHEFAQLADKVISNWKAAVTIYNPSYWIKNGIGEIWMSGMFGVNDINSYTTAIKLVKHAKGDGAKLEALKSLNPMLAHLKDGTPSGAAHAITTMRGEKLTYDDLLVAYHENSLKTGFFDNDLGRRMTPTRKMMDKNAVSRTVLQGHDKLRESGEGYEDMLRMAHFIHAVKNSNKPWVEAAKDAADEVRKAHFDYDDFSHFEKLAMMRAFPFYKWSRKAAPLMMQLLFLKPGKAVAPFKIQNTISNQMTGTDFADDKNGWMPNYTGMAPQFMHDMWAYEIFDGGGEDPNVSTRAPIPTSDVYNQLVNPMGMPQSLMTPLVKTPYKTINPDGEDSHVEGFMKNFIPQTKFYEKTHDKDGATLADFISFLGQSTFEYKDGQPTQGGSYSGGKIP